MKILLFSTFFLPAEKAGGVPFCTFYFARSLQSLGVEIAVITSDRNGEDRLAVTPDCWMEYQGVPAAYCKTLPGPYLFAPHMSLIARKEAKRVDVIISSSILWNHAGWLADKIAYEYKLPHLVYLHGILDPWAFKFKAFRKQLLWFLQGKRILKRASKIIALTENEKNTIKNLDIHTPIEVIPNGVNSSDLSDILEYNDLMKIYPQLKGNRYLLFLGRIHQKKGIDLLLPAFERTIHSLKDVILVLAGPVEKMYENEFNKLLARCKVADKVLFAGAVKGKIKNSLLHYASGFILTSYSEGLPLAALEALSVGCPVIITHQCNLPEVGKANAGWLVSLQVNEIGEAITELFTNKLAAKEKGENGKRLVQENFSWEVIGRCTMNVLKNL